MSRIIIEHGSLVAIEPTRDEIVQYADALAVGYNEPTNAELMGHTAVIPPADVIDSYVESIAAGMRAFLLFDNDAFAGDADLRGIRGTTAEFAFMIAARAAQGKGFGTRFALMVHAFGFRTLELQTIYASVVPHNTASRRVFEKLGYIVDESAAARDYADESGDVTLSLDRATFVAKHGTVLDQIRIAMR